MCVKRAGGCAIPAPAAFFVMSALKLFKLSMAQQPPDCVGDIGVTPILKPGI